MERTLGHPQYKSFSVVTWQGQLEHQLAMLLHDGGVQWDIFGDILVFPLVSRPPE